MDNDPSGKRDRGREYPSRPGAKPIDLKPAQLNSEPVREVRASEVTARTTPMSRMGDTAARERRVSERRPEATPLREYRPELRPEQHRAVPLREISVTPVQMHQLRERRVAARDLGWSLRGSRLLVDHPE